MATNKTKKTRKSNVATAERRTKGSENDRKAAEIIGMTLEEYEVLKEESKELRSHIQKNVLPMLKEKLAEREIH